MADIILMESDWWITLEIGVAYIIINYLIADYAGKDEVYILNWGSGTSSVGAYSPVFYSTTLIFIAMTMHFVMCLIT